MLQISSIHPDAELRDFLHEKISVTSAEKKSSYVKVYRDLERPNTKLPDDFIVVTPNGVFRGLGSDISFAQGNIRVDVYCKMNEDGSVKLQRVDKILNQFDELISNLATENFFFEYDMPRFITPTTPNYSTGYSVTILNLKWNTNQNYSKNN